MKERDLADPAARLTDALDGRYTIDRVLGEGGMATVYLSTDQRHGRQVAIKVLRPEIAGSIARDRFRREIEIVGQLIHPHILPLYDSGVIDDLCYFVMPNVAEDSLRDRMEREGQLPIDEAITITCEIADGLAYAHGQGVIHRDIKPENILLEGGHAVIADFGLALALDRSGSERLTGTGFSIGTPLYMSPEQAGGEARIDGRTDIYSLGCVLYEMLAGEPPFRSRSVQGLIAQHAMASPPPLRPLRDTVDPALERVCMRALAKAPADRYRSADELIHTLGEVTRERVRSGGVGPASAGEVSGGAGERPARRAGVVVRREEDQGPPAVRDAAASDPATYTAARSLGTALKVGAGLLGVLVLLLVSGFLTVTTYDAHLQMPARFTPSRTDYLVVGVRALFPSTIYALVALAAWLALYHLGRLTVAGAEALPRFGESVSSARRGLVQGWSRISAEARPGAVADGFLIGAVAISIVVVAVGSPLFTGVLTSNDSVLGCENRYVHLVYQHAMTLLILGLILARARVFRWVDRTSVDGARRPLARWGSAALIALLVMVMALPWSLVWDTGHERVRIGEERGYVLHETASELVVYNADQERTVAYDKAEALPLERTGILGYVFEEPHVFESGQPVCSIIHQ